MLANQMQKKYADVFQGIGCFKGTIHIEIRGYMPYQALPRCVPVGLQKPFKKIFHKMVKGV